VLSLHFIPSNPIVNTINIRNSFNPIIVPSNSDNPKLIHDDDSNTDFKIVNKKTNETFRFITQSAFFMYPHYYLAAEEFITGLEAIVNPKIKEYYAI